MKITIPWTQHEITITCHLLQLLLLQLLLLLLFLPSDAPQIELQTYAIRVLMKADSLAIFPLQVMHARISACSLSTQAFISTSWTKNVGHACSWSTTSRMSSCLTTPVLSLIWSSTERRWKTSSTICPTVFRQRVAWKVMFCLFLSFKC